MQKKKSLRRFQAAIILFCIILSFATCASTQPRDTAGEVNPGARSQDPETFLSSFFDAYFENVYLNQSKSIQEWLENDKESESGIFPYLKNKIAYWQIARQDITREDFQAKYIFQGLDSKEDAFTVHAEAYISYRYSDDQEPSSQVDQYDVDLVRADGKLMIRDLREMNDWFDSNYKGLSDAEFEKLLQELRDTLEAARRSTDP